MKQPNPPKLEFEHCADAYAQHRPGYPPALLDHLCHLCPPRDNVCVADVGAGTGIFTRELLRRGYRVVALEPGIAMLRRLVDHDPTEGAARQLLLAACAAAEALPLAAASCEMVTCAQSFHWFNPPLALAEFARILRPGGVLCLTWNNRDAAHPFVDEFEALIQRYNPAYRREYRTQDWAAKIDASCRFGPVEHARFAWTWSPGAEGFVGFTRSASYIRNVVPRERIAPFEAELRRLIGRYWTDGTCAVPMTTDCWTALRDQRSD